MKFEHKPVMLNECIEGLNIKKNGIYVDGTLGGAGHSKEIARALNNTGILIGIDRDQDALNAAKENLKNYNITINDYKIFNNINITILKDNYVILSKSSNPIIHFVIRHPKLVEAIENFNPTVKE